MKKTLLIYDDHMTSNFFIRSIIGDKHFGDVILKRRSIKHNFMTEIEKMDVIQKVLEYSFEYEYDHLIQSVSRFSDNIPIIHIFSYSVILDEKQAKLIFAKSQFIKKPVMVNNEENILLLMFPSKTSYLQFLARWHNTPEFLEEFSTSPEKFDSLYSTAFGDISNYTNFQNYITGGFDSRFFNSVKGDDYVVTKRSNNKKKMHGEYSFYYLLPDSMKMWFVMPFNYLEDDCGASYQMERYHVPDMAIRWVHGAVSLKEMEQLLQRFFHFINSRNKKQISAEDYKKQADQLYVTKVLERYQELKKNPDFAVLDSMIQLGTDYNSLEDIIEHYISLYRRLGNITQNTVSVIGHGDPCFSNILYHSSTNQLKFIDPKGAENEGQLWTDPYYDVAKISHSLCARYDFFNNGLYQISVGENLKFQLDIDFKNNSYIHIFKEYCQKNGFDYYRVRVYEISLFLSMLPLHMDKRQKVFGFILNAINLIKDVDKCLKV